MYRYPSCCLSTQAVSRAIQECLRLLNAMIGFIRLEDGVLDTFAAICMAALFAEHSDQGLQFAAILPLQVSSGVYHAALSCLWRLAAL